MFKRRSREGDESGAALATVLVMTAVMSGLAIVVVDAARFSLQRTANQTQMDQTRWYLLGAEAYAAGRIDQFLTSQASTSADIARWVGQPFTLPLENGTMQITVSDGGNCLNLNSLVTQAEDAAVVASEAGRLRFAGLLRLLNIENAPALAASLSDWVDADMTPALAGAEDDAYGGAEAAYLPPNRLIGDASEIRLVKGFDEAVIARIAPLVCARPTPAANALNINTLRADQASLLAATFGAGLTLAAAERVINERPPGGWATVDDFLRDPRLAITEISEETRSLFVTQPRWYVIAVRVQYQGVSETSLALIDAASGHPRTVRRVFGASPMGPLL